jgi:putative redox protein
MAFQAGGEDGISLLFDAGADSGGQGRGPSPVFALIAAAGACSGMDVVSILAKKKQAVERYEIEVEERRGPQGEYPRPILSLVLRHRLWGPTLDPEAVARAVELSDEKYCTVVSTLRHDVEVTSEWEANPD